MIWNTMMMAAGASGIRYIGGDGTTVQPGESAIPVNLPAGIVPGDFILLAFASDNTVSGEPLSGSSGYQERYNNNSSTPHARYYYKVATGADDVTATNGGSSAINIVVQVFRGVDTSAPFAEYRTTENGTTGSPDSPSISTDEDGMLISIGFLDDDILTAVEAPTDFENLEWQCGGGSYASTVMMASRLVEGEPGFSINPAPFITNGDDTWWAISDLLRPA